MRLRFGLLVGLFVTGCGTSDDRVAVHPVKGQVWYDGKPAAGVTVYFIPTSAPAVPQIPTNPHGTTGPDGTFELSTYGNTDGAAEGGYQVALSWLTPPPEGEEPSDEDKLLGWYGPAHSKLTAQVVPGSNVLAPFKLSSVTRAPGEIEGIPGKN